MLIRLFFALSLWFSNFSFAADSGPDDTLATQDKNNRLLLAIKEGQRNIVKAFLKKDPKLFYRQSLGQTSAIHLAALHNATDDSPESYSRHALFSELVTNLPDALALKNAGGHTAVACAMYNKGARTPRWLIKNYPEAVLADIDALIETRPKMVSNLYKALPHKYVDIKKACEKAIKKRYDIKLMAEAEKNTINISDYSLTRLNDKIARLDLEISKIAQMAYKIYLLNLNATHPAQAINLVIQILENPRKYINQLLPAAEAFPAKLSEIIAAIERVGDSDQPGSPLADVLAQLQAMKPKIDAL